MNTFILIVLGQIVSLFGNAALRFALPRCICCGRLVLPRCTAASPLWPCCPPLLEC